MYSNLLVDQSGGVAVITLNRPRVLNALSKALKGELQDVLRKSAADRSVRAIVLTGAGEAFSAGQDLNEAKDLDGAGAEEWVREYQRLYQQIRLLEIPVVAAVHGWCVGAGCQLALLADIRIASTGARFAMPEIKDGIPAIFGLSFLANIIGISRSLHLVLTGEALSATQALEAGMVSQVVPPEQLLDEARALAAKLAAYAPLAIKLDKQWARRLGDQAFHATVEFCVAAQREAFASGDAKREMEAFLAGARKAAPAGGARGKRAAKKATPRKARKGKRR